MKQIFRKRIVLGTLFIGIVFVPLALIALEGRIAERPKERLPSDQGGTYLMGSELIRAIPKSYGTLQHVVPKPSAGSRQEIYTLWFVDPQGVIRVVEAERTVSLSGKPEGYAFAISSEVLVIPRQ